MLSLSTPPIWELSLFLIKARPFLFVLDARTSHLLKVLCSSLSPHSFTFSISNFLCIFTTSIHTSSCISHIKLLPLLNFFYKNQLFVDHIYCFLFLISHLFFNKLLSWFDCQHFVKPAVTKVPIDFFNAMINDQHFFISSHLTTQKYSI